MSAASMILLAVATALHPIAVVTESPLIRSVSPQSTQSLSAYWPPVIQRWNDVIVTRAQEHGLDPDLVAAVIQQESNGYAWAVSAAGAVGLMQVVPFSGRPAASQLIQPDTNIAWGTLILSRMIRRADGDLLTGLAAYIGGWNRANNRLPRRQAAVILDAYVRAVAARQGRSEGTAQEWAVLLASEADDRSPHFSVIRAGPRAMVHSVEAADLAHLWPWLQGTAGVVVHTYQDGDGAGTTRLWLVEPELRAALP